MTDSNFRALLKKLKEAEEKDEVYIEGNIKIPEIYLNRHTGVLQLKGRSLPENAKELYLPVIKWIDHYLANPCDSTSLLFNLEYFNTSSSKMLTEIIKKLKQLDLSGKTLSVEWHYPSDDEDILELGKTFEEITGQYFTYCPYEG